MYLGNHRDLPLLFLFLIRLLPSFMVKRHVEQIAASYFILGAYYDLPAISHDIYNYSAGQLCKIDQQV